MDSDTILIHGFHAVGGILRREPARVVSLWVNAGRHDRRAREFVELARKAGVTVEPGTREMLDEKTGGARHQGIVARVRGSVGRDEGWLEALLEGLDAAPLLLVLDGVTDPHNLGACLRSAAAAGAQALVVPRDRAAGLTATVRKVASGAAEQVPLVQVTNLARALKGLAQRGVWIVGADGEARHSLYQTDLRGPLALVMGAEGRGMRRLTREHCDTLVRIPMAGAVSSLNVSVAAGIVLFEAVRQRSGS
jgi:23S rRNA (guanosine2251-2'-O)-methyltransferase